jgi:hypothetical protein
MVCSKADQRPLCSVSVLATSPRSSRYVSYGSPLSINLTLIQQNPTYKYNKKSNIIVLNTPTPNTTHKPTTISPIPPTNYIHPTRKKTHSQNTTHTNPLNKKINYPKPTPTNKTQHPLQSQFKLTTLHPSPIHSLDSLPLLLTHHHFSITHPTTNLIFSHPHISQLSFPSPYHKLHKIFISNPSFPF